MRVLVFGDSIAQGFWDVEGGWVSRLRKHFDKTNQKDKNHEHTVVFNLGVSADLTENVLDRFDAEVQAREFPGEEIAIVLAVGINDSILIDNVAHMDVYEFQEQYEQLVEKAKSVSERVLCVGLSAVDEKLCDPWAGSTTGKQWMNNRINLFEDAIKQVAIQREVDFIGVHDMFLKIESQGAKLLNDGLHPNNHGHELIAKIVQPAIEDLTSD